MKNANDWHKLIKILKLKYTAYDNLCAIKAQRNAIESLEMHPE